MAVTWGATGTAGTGTTSCTPAYPTGISSTTSELFCIAAGRSSVADTVISGPAGWTSLGQLEGGTGTYGVDTGTRRIAFFRKDTVAGTETGTETFSFASGAAASTISAQIFRVVKSSGFTVSAQFASGADTTNDTSYSVTSSSSLTWATDDFLLIGTAQNLDNGTQTAKTLTATGVTFGAISNQFVQAVTNGNDHRRILDTSIVSSASTTAAVTYAYTVSAAASGVSAFLRLRESNADVNVALTGHAATASAGTATPVPQRALLGHAVTAEHGLAVPERQRGQAMALAQQTIAAIGLTIGLTGQGIVSEHGTVSANNNGIVALTGQAITAEHGIPPVGWGQPLTGQAVSSAQQTPAITIRPTDISLPALTLSQGIVNAVGQGVTVHISGEESTFFTGNVASGGQLVSGIASSALQGTPVVVRTMPLTGEGMVSAIGLVAPSQEADDTYIASFSGLLGQQTQVQLLGESIFAGEGDFLPNSDKTAALSGAASTAAAGSVGFSESFALTGVQSDSAQHPFGAPGYGALTGAAVSVVAGDLFVTNDREFALTGQAMAASAGATFASPLAFVAGETMNIVGQEIGPRGATLEGLSILSRQGVLAPPVEPSTEAGRKREKKHRYVVRHRGQDIEFDDMDQALAYAAQAKAEEKALPRKERKSVRVIKPDDDNEDVLLWLV